MDELDVVSLEEKASTMNWKLGSASAVFLYITAFRPNICAEEMDILPRKSSRRFTFTDILGARSMSTPSWSFISTLSRTTRLSIPRSTLPMLTSVFIRPANMDAACLPT